MKKIFLTLIAFAAIFTQSCVKDVIYEGPASISNVAFSPAVVKHTDDVIVSAEISDLIGVTSATVVYKVDNGTENRVNMVAGTGNLYTGTIPKQADNAVVTFYVEALNDINLTSKSDEQSFTVGAIYNNLQLNELNGNDKFIEIYNKGTEAISLEGIYIQKDGETNWTCDARTIGAGQYLLLYSEDVTIAGEAQAGYPEALTFHSGLSAKKNVRVQLFTPGGASIDDFHLTAIAKTCTASYSRGTDGKWYHADATPNAVNAASTELVEGLE